ncbi:nodulation protein NfeD, partial [bacterium]|nr:nodulation protein NfeD [bacterium]
MFTIFMLVLVGLLLMFVELFVPGGIVGIIGGLLMAGGIYLSFQDYGPTTGVLVLTACILATITVAILAFKFLPRTFMGKWLILGDSTSKETGYHSDSYLDDNLVGKEGYAESGLRPSGIAMIDDDRIDVVTEGEYLAPKTRIKVIRVDGNRVVVE